MAFTIIVSPDGPSFECLDNQTVLDAALSNNLNISYGCQAGLCTSCEGKVLEGKVKGNFDALAKPTDPASVLFCQAIPLSDLKIEVSKRVDQSATEISCFPARVIERSSLQHLGLKIPANERFDALAGQKLVVSTGSGKALFEVVETTDHNQQIRIKLISDPAKATEIWNNNLVQVQGPFI